MPVTFLSVEEEYKRHPDLKREDVLVLMDWAQKQPHLPKMTEFQAAAFLHCSFFRMEAAKTVIENYFTVRTHCPELFANRTKAALKNQSNVVLFSILPKKTAENYHILFARLLNTDADLWDYNGMNMLLNMVCTLKVAQMGSSEGIILLVDSQGHNLGHVLKLNLPVLKKQMFYLLEALPIRLRSVHVFNANPIVDKILTILKPFLKGPIVENIHIHSSMDALHQYIPLELFPKEYGGTAPSFEELRDETEKNIFDNMDFFREEEKQLVDESKRLEKNKRLEELMGIGIEGTFKKLDID